jgi:4'-phosphopantetheinyl transferase
MPPTPAASPPPLSCDISVVIVPLDVSPRDLADLERTLSTAELTRAGRLAPPVRRRFIAGRGQLRRLLGRIVDDDPAALCLDSSPRGKPALGGRHAGRCHFNVSHSQDTCLVAVSRQAALGIDLECPAPERTPAWADMMCGSVLAAPEIATYRRLPAADRPTAVLEAWVAKEAILKGTAEGVAGGVRHLVLPAPLPRLALSPDCGPRAIAPAAVAVGPAGTWAVCLLDGVPGVAAVACAAGSCRVALVSPGRFATL